MSTIEANLFYDDVLEIGVTGGNDVRKTVSTSPCDLGCTTSDPDGGYSSTHGCCKQIGCQLCKYRGGSSLNPTLNVTNQVKPAPGFEPSPAFRNRMNTTADDASDLVRHVAPRAYANMTAHPESICRIGHDTVNVRPFSTCTATLGMYYIVCLLHN